MSLPAGDVGGKSVIMGIEERTGSAAAFVHLSHALCTFSEKKRTSRGQREKDGTRRSRWRFERRDDTVCCGRLGCPERFFEVACWIRDSGGMWRVMWGFCQAHLSDVSFDDSGADVARANRD